MLQVGTNCSGAATLDLLPIQPGYWRLDATTTDVRKCPDAEANCSTNFGQSGCVSTSACIGGTDVDALCEPSLGETFCQACDRSNTSVEVYFVPATDDRVAHCEPCGGAAMTSLFVLLGVVVALVHDDELVVADARDAVEHGVVGGEGDAQPRLELTARPHHRDQHPDGRAVLITDEWGESAKQILVSFGHGRIVPVAVAGLLADSH